MNSRRIEGVISVKFQLTEQELKDMREKYELLIGADAGRMWRVWRTSWKIQMYYDSFAMMYVE